MPRRPKNSSAKTKRSRPFKRSDATIEKWDTLQDIPLDEEDEFHASRDKILLEGEIEDDLEDDEEVFALKGLDEDESEEDEDGDEDKMQEDGKSSKSEGKKRKKKTKASRFSEEEEDEEEESWGRNASAYYSSNAAQIDSDDEEALELEENEAKRLQEKARDEMDENDFGLNDPHDENAKETDDLVEPTHIVLPVLPNDKKSIMLHLQKNNPEVLALAGDWDDSVQNLMRTREKLEKMQSTDPDSLRLGMIHLYYRTLITYTTNLAFYLHLRADEKYARRLEALRTHPIMARLLTLKQGLTTLEELDFAPTDSQDEFDTDTEMDLDELGISVGLAKGFSRLEPQELSELLKDALLCQEEPDEIQPDMLPKPPKKKRKTFKESSEPVLPIFDLVEPEFKSSKSTSKASTTDSISDAYGDVLSLQHADVADKSARRKSLRFHTAKIESTSSRRQGARHTLGGDDDIPYRVRQKERGARTKDRQVGADLDDTEPDPRLKPQNEDDGSDEHADPDGYYDLVGKKSKERKDRKKADYEAMKAAARQNQDEDTSGPRSLTKAILTNRGLTPHRSKSLRNPRVRKREKYEKAKKKVASQRAIYKDSLAGASGRYEGERSGISKVVKSVRLA